MPSVAAVVITYNAEGTVAECLWSLRWADHVIVVDSESTDVTVAAARPLADLVVVEPWRGFADQKNYAASLATAEWVLHVDADEVVPPALAAETRSAMAAGPETVGYLIPRQTFWLGHWIRHNGWYPDYSMRLYRRSRARWEGTAHEKAVAEGWVGTLVHPLRHYSYRSVQQHLERMALRAAPLEVLEAIEPRIRIYKVFPFGPVGAVVRRWWNGPHRSRAPRSLQGHHQEPGGDRVADPVHAPDKVPVHVRPATGLPGRGAGLLGGDALGVLRGCASGQDMGALPHVGLGRRSRPAAGLVVVELAGMTTAGAAR